MSKTSQQDSHARNVSNTQLTCLETAIPKCCLAKKTKASATKQTRSRATCNQKRSTKCTPSETKASDKEEDHHRNKHCRLTSFGSDIEEVELIGGESKENEGDMENVGSEAGVSVIYFAAKENMADEIN